MDERVWSHWRAAGGHSGGSSSWRPGWGINPTFCRESCIFRTVPLEQGAKPARASRDSFEPSSCEVMASPLVTKTGRGAAAGPRNCSARGHFLFAGPRLPFAHFGERSCFAVARCLSLLGSLLTAGLLPVAGDPYGVSPSRPRPLYGVRVYCAALKSGNSTVLLAARGGCNFLNKTIHAEMAGARALLIANAGTRMSSDAELLSMGCPSNRELECGNSRTVSVLLSAKDAAELLSVAAERGPTAPLRLRIAALPQRIILSRPSCSGCYP